MCLADIVSGYPRQACETCYHANFAGKLPERWPPSGRSPVLVSIARRARCRLCRAANRLDCELMCDDIASRINLSLATLLRTTLNIDDDLLIAVKEVARRESKSAGAVVSNLLRRCLAGEDHDHAMDHAVRVEAEFGFRPFPKRGGVVTNALIDRLREEVGD